jgi:hypothetical protein
MRKNSLPTSMSSLNSWAVAARVAIFVFALLAALAFWQVSGTLDYQPPPAPFPGWVAVLEPASTASTATQVQLQVVPLQPGAPGSHPALSYAVVACGSLPFSGVLLIGGDARLSKPRLLAPSGTSLASIANAKILDVGSGQLFPLGAVQALRFTLAPIHCNERFSSGAATSGIFGLAAGIAGLAGHAVVQPSRFGFWDGPRSAQSWPLLGAPPGIASTDLGEWRVTGLPGSWSRPLKEYVRLDAGSLTTIGSLEAARPALVDLTQLSWAGTSPFQASARLLDTTALGEWQTWLVVVTIVLTLAGSLLAAVLFDLLPPLRRARRTTVAVSGPVATTTQTVRGSDAMADTPSATDPRGSIVTVIIALAALYAWGRIRQPKRR